MEILDQKEMRKALENDRELLLERIKNTSKESINPPPINEPQTKFYRIDESKEHRRLIRARAESQLAQVEEALQRLDTGDYGKCKNCGKPIHPDRLTAIPSETLCINCKQEAS
ncbi:MAG: TraR/DksA family transcriptional regulator [Anaerolineales bacterium]